MVLRQWRWRGAEIPRRDTRHQIKPRSLSKVHRRPCDARAPLKPRWAVLSSRYPSTMHSKFSNNPGTSVSDDPSLSSQLSFQSTPTFQDHALSWIRPIDGVRWACFVVHYSHHSGDVRQRHRRGLKSWGSSCNFPTDNSKFSAKNVIGTQYFNFAPEFPRIGEF